MGNFEKPEQEQIDKAYEGFLEADYELLALKLMAAHGIDRAQQELAERVRTEALEQGAKIIRAREADADYA